MKCKAMAYMWFSSRRLAHHGYLPASREPASYPHRWPSTRRIRLSPKLAERARGAPGSVVKLLLQLRHAVISTGSFIETSSRSRVIYVFRRLKPTIAVSGNSDPNKSAIILAALCLHPIAYYDGSWAGALCPTDDVIAHLMLMRGDEPMFWRRANQYPPYRPEAGL